MKRIMILVLVLVLTVGQLALCPTADAIATWRTYYRQYLWDMYQDEPNIVYVALVPLKGNIVPECVVFTGDSEELSVTVLGLDGDTVEELSSGDVSFTGMKSKPSFRLRKWGTAYTASMVTSSKDQEGSGYTEKGYYSLLSDGDSVTVGQVGAKLLKGSSVKGYLVDFAEATKTEFKQSYNAFFKKYAAYGKALPVKGFSAVENVTSFRKKWDKLFGEYDSLTKVSSISLNRSSMSFNLNGTRSRYLTAKIKPALANLQPVTWSSSDKYYASVDKYGLVKAHRVGSCRIYAEAGGQSASCYVSIYN